MSKSKSSISRRNLIQLGVGAIGTGIFATQFKTQASRVQTVKTPAAPNMPKTADQALQKLLDGNKRFVADKDQHPHQNIARLKEVAKGQKPYAAILGCADSRVPLEIVFDQGLGDLFVVRNAGNIAAPEEIGSLEYGTLELGAKVLMVIGHQRCGAVIATLQNKPLPGRIGSIVEAIKPAVSKKGDTSAASVLATVKANVKLQISKLKKSPVISKLIKEGKLKIVGAYYKLDTGEVSLIA